MFAHLPGKHVGLACGLFLLLVLVFEPAYAQTTPLDWSNITPQTVLENLQRQLPNLMRMVTAIAYVMGMIFIFNGLLKLKEYGEARTMMSREHRLSGPIIYLAVGAMLLYLPTSIQVGMSTFWTNPNPYAYIDKTSDQWFDAIRIGFGIIQFIGVISFIRGLVILSHLGGGHGQQGTLSRGLMHIIGGILCINIYQFVQVVLMTLGVPSI